MGPGETKNKTGNGVWGSERILRGGESLIREEVGFPRSRISSEMLTVVTDSVQ